MGDCSYAGFPPDISISLDPYEITFRCQLQKCSEGTGLYQSIIQNEALTSILTKLYGGDLFRYRFPPDISISLDPFEITFRYQLQNVQKGRVYISQ